MAIVRCNREVRVQLTMTSPGKGGTSILSVDGEEVANNKIPHTIPFIITLGETFDVGVDTRTSADD